MREVFIASVQPAGPGQVVNKVFNALDRGNYREVLKAAGVHPEDIARQMNGAIRHPAPVKGL